eukprot:4751794-Alexandrium_andersonii.AAC.1
MAGRAVLAAPPRHGSWRFLFAGPAAVPRVDAARTLHLHVRTRAAARLQTSLSCSAALARAPAL